MKIRNGYVSNSSSSSFVIAYKKSCDMQDENDPNISDLFKFAEKQNSYESFIAFCDIEKNIEMLKREINTCKKWEIDVSQLQKEIDKLEKIKNDHGFVYVDIDNYDINYLKFVHDFIDKNDLKVFHI